MSAIKNLILNSILGLVKYMNSSRDFDINRFGEYRENNRLEIKTARDSLPMSIWETYSSFANSYGGVIILGVKERADGSWYTTGVQNTDKLLKQFWDIIYNGAKVSNNLLKDSDIEIHRLGEDQIIVIHVPRAKRDEKPIYINGDLFGGTFRRDGEGDYHCTPLQVKAMLRDQTEETYDMNILPKVHMSELNYDTVHSYRNRHRILRPGHPFEGYTDDEYLRGIGAAAYADEDGQLHPTAAGLLMFGNEFNIVRQFPEYFLDYREVLDASIRWTDRLQSSSGEWSGNLCDFYFRVYNKIQKDIKVPFAMIGGDRIDDTPVHKALREALANCLINADYFGKYGVLIKKESDVLTLENPGSIRVGKAQMILGGISDPRNKALMKMFNMINIGERAGSGVPNILQTWDAEQWIAPEVSEQFNPDRTVLKLSFVGREAVNMDDKNEYATTQATQATQANQATQRAYDRDKNVQSVPTVYALPEAELKIVSLILKQPGFSQKDIANKLGLNYNTVKYYINKLKKMNIISREGTSQKGHWVVRI